MRTKALDMICFTSSNVSCCILDQMKSEPSCVSIRRYLTTSLRFASYVESYLHMPMNRCTAALVRGIGILVTADDLLGSALKPTSLMTWPVKSSLLEFTPPRIAQRLDKTWGDASDLFKHILLDRRRSWRLG